MAKLSRALNIVILILALFDIYIISIGIAFNRDIRVPVVFPQQSKYIMAYNILNEEIGELNKTDYELREMIAKDLGLKFYFYNERSMEYYAGKTYVTIRLILMDIDANGFEYAQVFTHEVMHLKKMVANESWVCFETFKYLYEHEELHNVGVWYGQKQLQGCYGGEYNIADLIVNYLTNK